ncbi:MAG: YihA family ribosome biogenesis GTP-binding protein, partial [Pseudomonadota bacterium]|nr:YihA family ribosome biogenesis GTP-binding protein [Pseudomonadota bacterium]
VDVFSSLKGIGVDQLRNKMDEWFAPALADQLIDELENEEHNDSE